MTMDPRATRFYSEYILYPEIVQSCTPEKIISMSTDLRNLVPRVRDGRVDIRGKPALDCLGYLGEACTLHHNNNTCLNYCEFPCKNDTAALRTSCSLILQTGSNEGRSVPEASFGYMSTGMNMDISRVVHLSLRTRRHGSQCTPGMRNTMLPCMPTY